MNLNESFKCYSVNLNPGCKDSWISEYSWIIKDWWISRLVNFERFMNIKRFISLKNPMRFIHLQKFIELELIINLLFEATTNKIMPAYTGFRDFLASPRSRIVCFSTGETVHARLKAPTGLRCSFRCWGCCLVRSRKLTILQSFHESMEIQRLPQLYRQSFFAICGKSIRDT